MNSPKLSRSSYHWGAQGDSCTCSDVAFSSVSLNETSQSWCWKLEKNARNSCSCHAINSPRNWLPKVIFSRSLTLRSRLSWFRLVLTHWIPYLRIVYTLFGVSTILGLGHNSHSKQVLCDPIVVSRPVVIKNYRWVIALSFTMGVLFGQKKLY